MSVLRPAPGTRLAIIGDVGGHAGPLRAELARLGVSEGGKGPLPDDLTIVQVGDLVHRGPDSEGVVQLVDRHLGAGHERWVQLVGNHEAFYLRRQQFTWSDRIARRSAATLRGWWRAGLMKPAVAVVLADEEFLITHAGLTRGFWHGPLGSPTTAEGAADAVNALARSDRRSLFRPGTMLGYRHPDPSAGPVWAHAGLELAASWAGHRLPFSQVHGHSSVYGWLGGGWQLPSELRAAVQLDEVRKHASLMLEGGRLIGIDAGHDALSRGEWQCLELLA
ncbi:metallophosphoesterase [Micropruina sp.]|uniref:metallophosphoesterase n=1 Tax=Micropruina sp. TaxID=2737536 RepID=UPI0039E390D9